jgi:hypothetical protein
MSPNAAPSAHPTTRKRRKDPRPSPESLSGESVCSDINCPEARKKSAARMDSACYYPYMPAIGESTASDVGGEQRKCCESVQHCMDEECQRIVEEYCQACLDHQAICDLDGCQGTAHCDQCCLDARCAGQCSTSEEEVVPPHLRD